MPHLSEVGNYLVMKARCLVWALFIRPGDLLPLKLTVVLAQYLAKARKDRGCVYQKADVKLLPYFMKYAFVRALH